MSRTRSAGGGGAGGGAGAGAGGALYATRGKSSGMVYNADKMECTFEAPKHGPAWLQLVEEQTLGKILSSVAYTQHHGRPPFGQAQRHRPNVLYERRPTKVKRIAQVEIEYASRLGTRSLRSRRPDTATDILRRKHVQQTGIDPGARSKNKRVMVGVDPFRDPSMQGSNAVRMLQAAVHRSKTSTRRLPPRPKPKPGHPEITVVIGKPRPGTAARSAGSHVTYAATSTIAAAHRPMSAPTRDAPLHAPGTRTQGFFSPIGKPKFAHQEKGEALFTGMQDMVPAPASHEATSLLATIGIRPSSAPQSARETTRDLATELENRAEGMVNGIVRVSNKVQRYAKHTVAQWATVTQTEEEEDGAALHVILAPTDYDNFIKALDKATGGDFQFLAAVTSQSFSGPDITQEFKSDKPKSSDKDNEEDLIMSPADAVKRQFRVAKERDLTQAQSDEALFKATEINNTQLIYALLAHGTDVHGKRILAQPNQARPTDGMTPLCIAAGRGYEESVRTLLENGADRNRRNLKGLSPFDLAMGAMKRAGRMVAHGAIGAALKFRQAKECVAMLEDRSIMKSAKDGDFKRVRYLVVDGGIDPTTANQYGMTPLHFAVMNKDVKMALMLVKNGADPHFQNNVGQSPLSLAEDMPDMKQLVQSLKRHVSFQRAAERKAKLKATRLQKQAQQELGGEMRQAFRGTAAAPAVFNKYKKADVTKYKVPPKPKPKGLRDGGNRYLSGRKGDHTSKNIAKSVRFDGSLDHPPRSEKLTGSRARRGRSLYGGGKLAGSESRHSAALKMGVTTGNRGAVRTLARRKLPKADNARFDEFTRAAYGTIT